MSDVSIDIIEKNAAVELDLLAADLRELRQRTRPARVVRDLQDSAKHAVAPLLDKLGGAAKSYPMGIALLTTVVGAVAARLPGPAAGKRDTVLAPRHAAVYRKSNAPRMSRGKTALLVGLGGVLGCAIARRLQISDQEKHFVKAAKADMQRMFMTASMQHVNDILNGDSKNANAIKLALAGIAILTQRTAAIAPISRPVAARGTSSAS